MSASLHDAPSSRFSAKSVLIDLLSSMPARHPVAVGALVRGGAVLGVGENSLRVALARLRARGLVESDARGFYRLSSAAEPVNREVRSWRSIEQRVGAWDGSWVAVETSASSRGDSRAARTRTRALRLLGIEALTPALGLRPNNLAGGVDEIRRRLAALGHAPSPVAFRLTDLDPGTEARARLLSNPRGLEQGYRTLRNQLVASGRRLRKLPSRAAMAESFRLGGEAVRRIVLDPLLPEPIVDVRARRALFEEMRRYDRIGRACWKGWAGESVELERSPADGRGLAGAA